MKKQQNFTILYKKQVEKRFQYNYMTSWWNYTFKNLLKLKLKFTILKSNIS